MSAHCCHPKLEHINVQSRSPCIVYIKRLGNISGECRGGCEAVASFEARGAALLRPPASFAVCVCAALPLAWPWLCPLMAQRISRTAEVWEAAVGAINAQYGTSHGVNVRMRGGMYLQAGGKPAPQPVPGVLQCLGRTPGGRLRWRLPLLPALSAYGAPYNHFRSPPSGYN
eukprot:XP_001703107.1 predicted protein [Chlamydomonas reinhardtii]